MQSIELIGNFLKDNNYITSIGIFIAGLISSNFIRQSDKKIKFRNFIVFNEANNAYFNLSNHKSAEGKKIIATDNYEDIRMAAGRNQISKDSKIFFLELNTINRNSIIDFKCDIDIQFKVDDEIVHRKLRVNKSIFTEDNVYICLTYLDILNKPRKYNINVEFKTLSNEKIQQVFKFEMRDKKPYIEQKIKCAYFSIFNKSLYKTIHKSNIIDRGHYFGHYK
ncbi:hypothetical protein LPC27_05215 [Paraclostridium bifermentans]|uniref:hypothetical protein n=1 Tax=Paraclostridium bifermentans TaxID=1490 RepID=UPI001F22318A|nr:hypothetical protein [Paraclostridium bifermentans]MCE9675156.1 hypothetical protein [Paraclostridium bifermentans]